MRANNLTEDKFKQVFFFFNVKFTSHGATILDKDVHDSWKTIREGIQYVQNGVISFSVLN